MRKINQTIIFLLLIVMTLTVTSCGASRHSSDV